MPGHDGADTGPMTAATASETTALQGRARRLRAQAGAVHPVLADAYRRRAAELDAQAFLEAVWNPSADVEVLPTNGPSGTTLPAPLAASAHRAVA